MKVSFVTSALVALIPFSVSAETPKLHDDRVEITLFSEDPEIVTPIGMAIDAKDRIFVLESHTHHPPKDYQGPTEDRIKVFVDENNDGQPDKISVFAEGINQGMNLAFSPNGLLYAVCAREVLAFPDKDDDGTCDGIEKILTLDTKQRYAHNSLLGITFDREGWLYIARGNTGSDAWAVKGKDGTEISGYGDGGNVFRCRPDGSQVEEVATGFWNPFNLKFDMEGRLLLVDNDPDARGPNRLVHVVRDGDYGYKSVYGGGGNHPFQGWDGSMPGTLPYIAGTGEAPCDLIDCKRLAFPKDYHGSVLATIWNENTVERFDLKPGEGTLTLKEKSLFLSGDKDFRPVALEADSRGNLFLTDWVLVDYPNHGRGRIWRITSKTKAVASPKGYFDYLNTDGTTAETLIAQRVSPKLAQLLADQQDGKIDRLPHYLADSSPEVKRSALIWAGTHLDPDKRPLLDSALDGTVNVPMFEAYLAAVENLSGTFAADFKSRKTSQAQKLERQLDPYVLVRIAEDENFSDQVRALALQKLPIEEADKQREWIEPLALSGKEELQLAAIRKLGELAASKPLLAIAADTKAPTPARCEALLALSTLAGRSLQSLTGLLSDKAIDVAIEASRALRWHVSDPAIRQAFEERLPTAKGELAEQLAFALKGAAADRPSTVDTWKETLSKGGDPVRGRRVFFTTQYMCARCHSIDGSIALLGPSLAGIAQSVGREQIIHSILHPSDQFPPQYQAWIVHTKDGASHMGLQLDHKAGGAIELLGLDAKTMRFEANDISNYEATPHSLMPQGLEHLMPVGDFRNLVAFLSSLK